MRTAEVRNEERLQEMLAYRESKAEVLAGKEKEASRNLDRCCEGVDVDSNSGSDIHRVLSRCFGA